MKELMERLTTLQSNILIQLARYKFLTVSQLYRLGLSKDISWIRTQARELSQAGQPLIDRINFNITPHKGKVENIYFLTKKGKEALIEGMNKEEKSIKVPIGNPTNIYKDYTHRKNTIDFQIEAYLWAETQERGTYIDFFDCYFDKIGNNRTAGNLQAKNKIALEGDDYIIPDAVFLLETEHRPYLFLFEMYDGRDTKRVIDQVTKHVKAIELGTPSDKYNHPYAHRVILLFEFEEMKNAFLSRTHKDSYFDNVSVCFKCKSIEAMQKDFFGGWKNLKEEMTNFI